MGYIELSDGLTNRRIQVPSLSETIRIEVAADGGPRIVVSEGTAVEYVGSADSPSATAAAPRSSTSFG